LLIGAAPDVPTVGVVTVRNVMMAPAMAVPGTVVSRNDSQLASEVEGRVSWVADVGTVVKQNDVVVKVDASLASLQLASDRANVARLAAQLRFDRNQADRMDNLYRQNAIAKATRDQAGATRDMDAAALAQAQAALQRSEYQLAHGGIRAPFPGRVVARLVNPGEYVTAGKAVVRLVDVGSLEVSVQAPIDVVRNLRETMTVMAEISGKRVAAVVRAIVPVGDIVSRTIEIRLSLPPGSALVGDAAKAMIPSAAPRTTLAVPRDALVLREENTYIFKVDKRGTAQRVAVETGTEQGAMVEVRGAVAPGDSVIVRGAERLATGQKVRAVQIS
jgi:RND family efflux transporter MFP subunit